MHRWSDAMNQALYGPAGFYTSGDGASRHFRTSVTASKDFTDALATLVQTVDDALGRPTSFDLVDVGADEGQALTAITQSPRLSDSLRDRLHVVAVELRQRPAKWLHEWRAELPKDVCGLIFANELLDNVGLDVVAVDDGRQLRQVLVEPQTGVENLGEPPDDVTTDWLNTWWPLSDAEPGARAEVGTTRDQMWGHLVASLSVGVVLGVDYAHTLTDRKNGVWSSGTLRGFRDGYVVAPIPNGTCDITAHVALDACEQSGKVQGVTDSSVCWQADALRRLGVEAIRPPAQNAIDDPTAYLRELVAFGQRRELVDPQGFGGFGWLAQSRGVSLPDVLVAGSGFS